MRKALRSWIWLILARRKGKIVPGDFGEGEDITARMLHIEAGMQDYNISCLRDGVHWKEIEEQDGTTGVHGTCEP